MTDEQIEKALNACTFGYLREKCRNCPLDSEKEPCMTNLHLAALEYIGRLKHRAKVAERALRIVAKEIPCDEWCPFSQKCNVELNGENGYQCCFDEYLRQAEKELAEERKSD